MNLEKKTHKNVLRKKGGGKKRRKINLLPPPTWRLLFLASCKFVALKF